MAIPDNPIAMTGWFSYRHIPYPLDSPPDILSRRIVALRLPKKEFFEVVHMAHAVRSFIDPLQPLFDCCCGHGMLGMLLGSDERVPRVVLLDRKFPPNLERLQAALVGNTPSLQARVELAEVWLHAYSGFSPGALVASHACGLATERIIEAALRNRARFLVMTCCISREVAKHYGVQGVRGRVSEINGLRLRRAEEAGYAVEVLSIDDRITPWNTILVGWPREQARFPHGGLRPPPLPAGLPRGMGDGVLDEASEHDAG